MQNADKTITTEQVDILYDLIKSRAVEKDFLIVLLKEMGYDNLMDIKIKDYKTIVNRVKGFWRD